jgi:hypothetical protein
MPRYWFAVHNGDRYADPQTMELSDDAAAREYAIRVIRELRRGDEDYWKGWTMEVTQNGRRVCEILFDEIDADEGPS